MADLPAAAIGAATSSLGQLLKERLLPIGGTRALRVRLNHQDRSDDFTSTADLVRLRAIGLYERMQDGRMLGADTPVLTFAAEGEGRARLVGYRRFVARRKGLVPGDIVYDYDAAHLLHSFIARARCPVFYDAFDLSGLDDLLGRLVVAWPAPMMRNIRAADDPGLQVIEP